jgi:transcriptional regulator with XRE-family HTH domain
LIAQTKRGRTRKDRQPRSRRGRQQVPLDVARAISVRLRAYVKSEYETLFELREALGLPKSTLQGWLSRSAPRVPDTAALLALAKEARISLNWLLLGVGPEQLGAALPTVEAEAALRMNLVAEVRSRGVSEWVAEKLIPDARTVYRHAADDYARLGRAYTKDVGTALRKDTRFKRKSQ